MGCAESSRKCCGSLSTSSSSSSSNGIRRRSLVRKMKYEDDNMLYSVHCLSYHQYVSRFDTDADRTRKILVSMCVYIMNLNT